MASTLTTSAVASTKPYRAGESPVIQASAKYSLAAALVVNDVIQMVKIPSGAYVLDTVLACDDLDATGTPLIVMAVGDDGVVDRFITGSVIGKTGGIERLNNKAGKLYKYTADNTIDVKVTTAPGASPATTGDITLTVFYTMQL